jgi:hypothetical protein
MFLDFFLSGVINDDLIYHLTGFAFLTSQSLVSEPQSFIIRGGIKRGHEDIKCNRRMGECNTIGESISLSHKTPKCVSFPY